MAGMIFSPHIESQVSPANAPLGGEAARKEEEGKSLDPLALAAAAVLMVTPIFFYAVDSSPSHAQRDAWDHFQASVQGGAGAGFPDSALFRASALGRYRLGLLGIDWTATRGGGNSMDRLSPLLGINLPPKRHVEMSVVGGPILEWANGERHVGAFFALPSRFLLPHDFQIRFDPRIGRVGSHVTAEIGGHLGVPLGSHTHVLIGGQVLFRGRDAIGGPQVLLECSFPN
jgi:hypothetical protein